MLAIFVNQPCFPLLSIVGDIKDHFQDPLLRRMRGCLPKTRSKPASILSSSPPHPPLLISSSPLFVPKSFLPAINYFPAAITNLEFKAGQLIFLPIRDVCYKKNPENVGIFPKLCLVFCFVWYSATVLRCHLHLREDLP